MKNKFYAIKDFCIHKHHNSLVSHYLHKNLHHLLDELSVNHLALAALDAS